MMIFVVAAAPRVAALAARSPSCPAIADRAAAITLLGESMRSALVEIALGAFMMVLVSLMLIVFVF